MENMVTQNQDSMEEPRPSAGSTALYYGIIGGIALSILSIITFLLDLRQNASWVGTVLSIAIFVAAIFIAAKTHRDQKLGGTISFGTAFTVGFLTSLVMAIIGGIFMYVYMQFIDPSVIVEAEREIERDMATRDISREDMDQAMRIAKAFVHPGVMALMALIVNVIIGLIVALIAGAVYQREN